MSTTGAAEQKSAAPRTIDARVLSRIFNEGYGPGAWHGADMKAAIADVGPDLAFWRPAPGRHNIAEIVLHHAYCTRSVRAQLSGEEPEPFVVDGEDWFDLPNAKVPAWKNIRSVLDTEEKKLAAVVGDARGTTATGGEPIDLVLGITCHAVYHAGQIQLIKRLHAG